MFFFFFQAEDGIRDWSVTGVQTCALPICASSRRLSLFARLKWKIKPDVNVVNCFGGSPDKRCCQRLPSPSRVRMYCRAVSSGDHRTHCSSYTPGGAVKDFTGVPSVEDITPKCTPGTGVNCSQGKARDFPSL